VRRAGNSLGPAPRTRAAGRAWAEQDATFAELRRVAKIEVLRTDPEDWAYDALANAIDPEKELERQEFHEQIFRSADADPSGIYLLAFIQAAADFFYEVRPKL
jgi:hypothetical protein